MTLVQLNTRTIHSERHAEEDPARTLRQSKLALAQEGSRLFEASCARMGLDPNAPGWQSLDAEGTDGALLEEALMGRLEERGLA